MQFANLVIVRLLQAILTIFVVVSIVFIVSRVVGNPETSLLPPDATNEDYARIREKLGLNEPLIVQYGRYLADAVQFDFGQSFRIGGAMELVGDRAWNTIKLGLAAIFFALALAVPLGIIAAIRRGTGPDWLARLIAFIGQAIPDFLIGLAFVFFIAVRVDWFPTGGADGGFRALILPAIALSTFSLAAIMRLIRSGMIDVMNTDYVRTARAKGLSEPAVILRHGLRNALLPVITLLGVQIGRLIAGAVIIEVIFSWPGVGRLVVDSIYQSDYNVVLAGVLVLSFSIVVVNLLVDISYPYIDPRIRTGQL